jgi:hypothetical protein
MHPIFQLFSVARILAYSEGRKPACVTVENLCVLGVSLWPLFGEPFHLISKTAIRNLIGGIELTREILPGSGQEFFVCKIFGWRLTASQSKIRRRSDWVSP